MHAAPVTVALALGTVLAGGCGDDAAPVTDIPRCAAPPRPHVAARVELVPAFEAIAIDDAVSLVQPPALPTRWYVVAQSGAVWTFDEGADVGATRFVDLTDVVEHDGEAGLLDVAFHPRFPEVPSVYFSYNRLREGQLVSLVTRMTSADGGLTLDRASEATLLEVEQPYSNHNGGEIAFGPDGMLYLGLGDGGSGGDPHGNGQRTDTLLGKVLRIDVDVDPGGGAPYAIPPDNPFANGGGLPEIYAVGFRNPWRFSFDRETGDLWLGDVGQHAWEEIDRVVLGGNYGWSVMEGPDCFAADTCDTAAHVAPVASYRNTGGASVIGGVVSRGSSVPGGAATYVFSDFFFGTIFGIDVTTGAVAEIGEGAGGVSAWAESAQGEVYALRYRGGIARLAPVVQGGEDPFPRRLSATGCVDVRDPRAAVDATVPYEVRVPFWSDGADKTRAIAVAGAASVGANGDWDLPSGTVLVKSFFRGDTPVETRLLVRHVDGGWAGYGYAWREDGSDADYVETTREATVGGAPWVFPASRECAGCHTEVAGGSLGWTSGQLAVGDQLAALADAGAVDAAPLADPLPVASEGATVEALARAYLDVNCSMCHQPDGPAGRTSMDLRYATPLAETALCDAPPRGGDLGIEGAVLVAPGDPTRSVLSARLRSTGFAHMPPIGIRTVDEEGADLVDAWIAGMTGCP